MLPDMPDIDAVLNDTPSVRYRCISRSHTAAKNHRTKFSDHETGVS